jgi:putative ubiquitin-RnfH superfamily antitoxin RatB of RatAB toxin-antitoxin module
MRHLLQWLSDHLTALVALAAVVSSLMNRKKLKALHVELNSRLSEFIRVSGASERAKGIEEGRQLGSDERQSRVKESERVEDRADKKAHNLQD